MKIRIEFPPDVEIALVPAAEGASPRAVEITPKFSRATDQVVVASVTATSDHGEPLDSGTLRVSGATGAVVKRGRADARALVDMTPEERKLQTGSRKGSDEQQRRSRTVEGPGKPAVAGGPAGGPGGRDPAPRPGAAPTGR